MSSLYTFPLKKEVINLSRIDFVGPVLITISDATAEYGYGFNIAVRGCLVEFFSTTWQEAIKKREELVEAWTKFMEG